MKMAIRIISLLISLLFPASAYSHTGTPEKGVILSIGINDHAFTDKNYSYLEVFFSEYYPNHRYVFTSIAQNAKQNNILIQKAVQGLSPDERIDIIIINTHGLMGRLKGIGTIETHTVDKNFQNFIDSVKNKISPNTKLIINACYAICGNDEDAIRTVENLRKAFDNKIEFVYASRTSETSTYDMFYTNEKFENSHEFLKLLEIKRNDLVSSKIAALLMIPMSSYLSIIQNFSVGENILMAAIGLPIIYQVTKALSREISRLNKAIHMNQQKGENNGRTFTLVTDKSQDTFTTEEIQRDTPEGHLKSNGVNSIFNCAQLFR